MSRPSTAGNFAVPTTLLNVAPAPIARGTDVASRALVRNTGPVMVFVGFSAMDVAGSDGPGSAAYRIAPGDSDVFVLMPTQVLYAVAAGGGGSVTTMLSPALPLL